MKRIGLTSLCLATAMTVTAFAEVKSTKPWLGVMLSPVGAATSRQLAIEPDSGIMVTNVATDSPAADAGIQQYDVIVGINGEQVSSDFAAFSEDIAAIGVGGKAVLNVIRSGQQVTVNAILSEMPLAEEITYLHEGEPNVVTQFDRNVFGKIVEKDDDGNWVMRDLGELEDFNKILGDNGGHVFGTPGFGPRMRFNFNMADGDQRVMSVTRDGSTIEVSKDETGQITVRRSTDDQPGTVDEQMYDSEEALQNADEEAYELFKQFGSGSGVYSMMTPDGNFQIELKQQITDALETAHQAMADAHAAANDAVGQQNDLLHRFQIRTPNTFQSWPSAFRWEQFSGGPKTSFTLEADGSIVVTTRDAEAVLTRTYASEADLQQRDPKLYEKYVALHDAE